MPEIVFSNVAYGKRNEDVRIYQEALVAYLKPYNYTLIVDGWFGDQTRTRTANLQRIMFGYGTGVPGPLTFARLGLTNKTATPPPPTTGAEPVQNMVKTTWSGRVINTRTKVMLQQAQAKFGKSLTLSQGSYTTAVSASAGTHAGGGVVDISVGGLTTTERSVTLIRALRQVGFATWLRTPREGFSYHVHAVAIGDAQTSSSAKRQVVAYFNGRNGLASNGPDTAPSSVGRPYPAWTVKYRSGW